MADLATTGGTSADIDALEDVREDVESISDIVMDVEMGESTEISLEDVTLNLNNTPTPRAADTTNTTRPTLTRGLHREYSRWGVSSARLLRKSTAIDLETGQAGGKETIVEEVTSHQDAMNPTQRVYNHLFGIPETEEQVDFGTASPKQYRLTARPVSIYNHEA